MLRFSKVLPSSPPALRNFAPDEHAPKTSNKTIGASMTFSQKSDLKIHLAHPLKKTHYLTPEVQSNTAEKADESSAGSDVTAALLDDREPILVLNRK
jgi:hypothetical protein